MASISVDSTLFVIMKYVIGYELILRSIVEPTNARLYPSGGDSFRHGLDSLFIHHYIFVITVAVNQSPLRRQYCINYPTYK